MKLCPSIQDYHLRILEEIQDKGTRAGVDSPVDDSQATQETPEAEEATGAACELVA